jgi:hypothetical protein
MAEEPVKNATTSFITAIKKLASKAVIITGLDECDVLISVNFKFLYN